MVDGSEQYDVTIKLNKNEVIDMTCTCPYAETITANARNVADRTIYREWVSMLKHMRKIPGGESVVDEIVRTWRTEYRRRKAMMEELDRL